MGQAPPPPPPPPSDAGPPASPAGLGRRFGARVLDAVIVGLPASIILAILGLPAPTMGLGGVDAWAHSAVTSLLWLAYYVYFESTRGATLGKRLLGLRVVGPTGAAPDVAGATQRNVWIVFGLLPLVGGLVQLVAVIVIAVTISTSDDGRGKHDEFAGTAVLL